MNMKPWYLSKTIIGALLTTLCLVLAGFGLDITPEEQGDVADTLVAAAEGIAAVVGVVLTIVGRLAAKTKLTK